MLPGRAPRKGAEPPREGHGRMTRDPTARFSDRVASYVRARPGYPPAVLDAIEEETGLRAPVAVADVGSGTGIFSALLLERGHTVHAVEPNAAMREAAEAALGRHPAFRSVDGRAEATTLDDASVDLVTAAQAFHWFDPEATREEWRRILRPRGWVALLWNDRITRGEPFLEAYEAFLEAWGTDYREVRSRWDAQENLAALFGEAGWREARLANEQRLDLEGLTARVLSSSYIPGEGHPRHLPMLDALGRVFDEHESGGTVRIAYRTTLHVGTLSPATARP